MKKFIATVEINKQGWQKYLVKANSIEGAKKQVRLGFLDKLLDEYFAIDDWNNVEIKEVEDEHSI